MIIGRREEPEDAEGRMMVVVEETDYTVAFHHSVEHHSITVTITLKKLNCNPNETTYPNLNDVLSLSIA